MDRFAFRRLAVAAALVLTCGCAAGSPSSAGSSTPPGPAGSGSAPASGQGTGSSGPAHSSPSGSPSGSRRPPAPAGALLLRLRVTGGIAGVGRPSALPDYSLYSDGRVMIPGPVQGALPTAREYRLRPGTVAGFAREARRLGLDRPRRIEAPGYADVFNLVITFVVDGRPVRTEVAHPEGDDPTRRAIAAFQQRLQPASWPPGDPVGPATTHAPHALVVFAVPLGGQPPGSGAEVTDWPLVPLPAAGGCVEVPAGSTGRAVRLARSADPRRSWRSGGQVFAVTFRPLLPDERDCRTLSGAA